MNNLDLTDIEENLDVDFINYMGRVDRIFVSSKIDRVEQIEELKKFQIEMVIDLKEKGETEFDDRKEFENSGIKYQNFPITSFSNLDFDSICQFSKMIESTEKNTLVYCISSNRVGAMMALYLAYKCGHPKKRAFEIGCKLGMTKDELKEKIWAIFNAKDTQNVLKCS